MTYSVVCIMPEGTIRSFPCQDYAHARRVLKEKEHCGLYTTGSIYNSEGEEFEGFGA